MVKFTTSGIQTKITRRAKSRNNMTPDEEKKNQLIKTDPELTQGVRISRQGH